jgi:hypothetical protein
MQASIRWFGCAWHCELTSAGYPTRTSEIRQLRQAIDRREYCRSRTGCRAGVLAGDIGSKVAC